MRCTPIRYTKLEKQVPCHFAPAKQAPETGLTAPRFGAADASDAGMRGTGLGRAAGAGSTLQMGLHQGGEPVVEDGQAARALAPVGVQQRHRHRRRAPARHDLDELAGIQQVLHIETGIWMSPSPARQQAM